MNVVILSGNLGKDAEIFNANTGSSVIKLSLATSKYVGKDENGISKYKTTWHPVEMWHKTETANKLVDQLKKGTFVSIQGEMNESKNEKDGKTFYKYYVKAEHIEIRHNPTDTNTETVGVGATAEQQEMVLPDEVF
ncbi:MAG: single-stranded DNA-binding protein [Raineya sp.]|jgi:single stranded DNA-binding protein|nr:single-stranded DNA-binding protein [Raineya sp.]